MKDKQFKMLVQNNKLNEDLGDKDALIREYEVKLLDEIERWARTATHCRTPDKATISKCMWNLPNHYILVVENDVCARYILL